MTKTAKKALLLPLIILFVAVLACSCGSEKNPSEATDHAVTNTPDASVTTAVYIKPEQINYAEYYPLYVQEGLLYHMSFAAAEASDDLLSSQAKYTPYVVGKDERLNHPWWDGFQCSLGDGYLNFKGGANILSGVKENLNDGGDLNIIGAKHVSVELVAKAAEAGRSTFLMGLDLEFQYNANGAQFYRDGSRMDPDKTFITVTMGTPFNGFNINTYTLTYGFNDVTDNTKYDFNAYGNGKNYANQVIKSDSVGYSGYGLFDLTVGALKIYAVRVYEIELREEEALQNHFIDVAMLNGFDLTEFKELDAAKKQSVYKAMEFYAADEDYEMLAESFVDAMAAVK